MIRTLSILNVCLLSCLGGLLSLDLVLEARREAGRVADSAFHLLAEPEALALADVQRVELTLPGAAAKHTYLRQGDGWHLPQFRDGFALTQELEGFLKSLLESRGTIVGRTPADAAHFGIVPGRTVEAEMYDGAGKLRLHALCGDVAPGQRSGECFVTAEGRDPILHLGSNPRSYMTWTPATRTPPLADRRVIPLALGRGLPSKVTFGGPQPPAVRELIRRDIPKERLMAMGPDRGPRFEWFGTTPEGEKRINDNVCFAFTSFLSSLEFDDLLGQRTGNEPGLAQPALTVTLEYEEGKKDTLTLGSRAADGSHLLHHSATNQVFLIAAARAAQMQPDQKAILELPPPREPPPPGAAVPGLPEGIQLPPQLQPPVTPGAEGQR